MQWYTLIYRYADGTQTTLYNLQKAGVDSIIAAQSNLGSYDFAYEPQRGHYHQFEIDLLRGRK